MNWEYSLSALMLLFVGIHEISPSDNKHEA